jgi:hypothetical protein
VNRRTVPAVAAAVLGIAVILAAVGGPAAVASYHHAYQVFVTYGEDVDRAAWLPLTTDGMLAAALVVMYARRWGKQPVGFIPWLAFVVGFVGTIAANLASAKAFAAPTIGDGVGRLAAAVWPPIVFAVTLELVAVMLGRVRDYVTARREVVSTWPPTWLVGIPEYPYLPPPAEDAEPVRVPDPAPAAPVYPPLALPVPVEGIEQWARTRTRGTRRTRPAAGTPETGTAGTPDPGTNGRAVRWTEQDEAYRIDLQTEADRTRERPSVRSVSARYGIGKDRARKILDRVTVPGTPAEDTEPVR